MMQVGRFVCDFFFLFFLCLVVVPFTFSLLLLFFLCFCLFSSLSLLLLLLFNYGGMNDRWLWEFLMEEVIVVGGFRVIGNDTEGAFLLWFGDECQRRKSEK